MRTKKSIFANLLAKVIHNRPKVICSDQKIANQLTKVIRNYPKNDSHLASRICIFPAPHAQTHTHAHAHTHAHTLTNTHTCTYTHTHTHTHTYTYTRTYAYTCMPWYSVYRQWSNKDLRAMRIILYRPIGYNLQLIHVNF